MAGEIHGIISRQDAWRMWAPYGERGIVHMPEEIDSGSLTTHEVYGLLKGATKVDMTTAFQSALRHNREDMESFDLEGVAKISDKNSEVLAIAAGSYKSQQSQAEAERSDWFEYKNAGFMRAFETGIQRLQCEGFITARQLEYVQQNLWDDGGLPRVQVTPMTYLERNQQDLTYLNTPADFKMAGFVDYRFGILYKPVKLDADNNSFAGLALAHEGAHGYMQGMELYDVTRADGWRYPDPVVQGVMRYESPTVDMPDGGIGYGNAEDMEINEGNIEYIARTLARLVPELGADSNSSHGNYRKWSDTVSKLYRNERKVYRAIMNAFCTEATPQNPDSKREAIADMHAIADRTIGTANALTKLFHANGTILDIFTKGKK